MKPKDIVTPADLITGDYIIIVTWEKHKATPAKVEKASVKEIFPTTHLNLMYGPGPEGLGLEWDKKRWHFEGFNAWDLRKAKWGDEYPTYNSRGTHKLFHLSDLEEAERFANVEVPKRQLDAVMKRIDTLKNNFTSKIEEMEKLERILQKNIDSCNTAQLYIV